MIETRQLHLEWVERGGRTCLRVRGWTESELHELGGMTGDGLDRRLAVLSTDVLETGIDFGSVPPLAGSFALELDAVCFIPKFPFMDGIGYTLLVHPEGNTEGPAVWAIWRPAPPLAPSTEVVAIYPTAGVLPVNLLRIYVYFSGPMSEGWAGRSVRARCEDTGEVLEGAFMPPDPELWDPQRRRLTMLLDPGRIKRGLVPNQEVGYPLIEGTTIKVTVDSCFRDAAGQPLKSGAERRYRIGPALRSQVFPARWRLTAPESGSLGQLGIEFDRPLDHALLLRSLTVCDSSGAPVPGRGVSGAREKSWSFIPDTPWREGAYRLLVKPSLEDVAGNSLLRAFDRDITEAEFTRSDHEPAALDFSAFQPNG